MTIEKVKGIIANQLSVDVKKLTDKVASRLYAYGVVPFSWDAISFKHELKLAKKLQEITHQAWEY